MPCPPPGGLPNPRIKPRSPTLQADFLPSELPGKPKSTAVGSLSLLQGIFLTQELNWGLQHCRQILYQLGHLGSPCLPYSISQSHVVSKPVFSIYLNFKVHFLKVSKIGAPNGHIWNKIMVVLNYNPKYKINIRESNAKNLALCAPKPEGSTETEFWKNKENPFNLCLAKGKQQANVSRTVPFSLGNRERFYIPQKVFFFFFFFCKISNWSKLASGKGVCCS